ncbi:MAG TPA: hypothetical protein VEB40_11300 [Flavipsychrobacter sp.]|nr:hypothetical protein [Flavipsychrobacter sp.]
MKNIILLTLLLWVSNTTIAQTAQKTKVLQLKNEKMRFVPKDHHISLVVDDRADTTNIGFVKTGFSDKKTILKLKGGIAPALQAYIRQNLEQDTTTTAIELHINEMDVAENRSSGIDKAELNIGFSYYAAGEKVISYTSSAYIKSGLDATMYVEEMLRKQTESGLEEFDQWWAKNKAEILAAPSVVVEAEVDNNPKDTDYIPYSARRPLAYADFKAPADKLSLGAAATYSGVSLNGNFQTLNKQVTLKLKIGALFNQQRSWFKPGSQKQYLLDHEQVHFDITACIACEFLHTLREYKFSFENYSDELEKLKKEAQKTVEALQDQYDEETDHGTITAKQAEWKAKIGERIKKQDCY